MIPKRRTCRVLPGRKSSFQIVPIKTINDQTLVCFSNFSVFVKFSMFIKLQYVCQTSVCLSKFNMFRKLQYDLKLQCASFI